MYIIKLTKQADKKRRLFPYNVRKNISKKLKLLQNWDITNLDLKKLRWNKKLRRLRVWKYRILFEKYDDKLIILVIDIWSRGDIYK